MSKRNENVIVIVLESVELDREFIEWPLHITIVPWFHGYNASKLDSLLSDIAARHHKFTAKVGQLEKFGPKKDVAVNVLDDSDELKSLHQSVFKRLENDGFSIHQKDFVGEAYRAHITRQSHGYINKGKLIEVKTFSLIQQERLKKTGEIVKKIVKNYELG